MILGYQIVSVVSYLFTQLIKFYFDRKILDRTLSKTSELIKNHKIDSKNRKGINDNRFNYLEYLN